MTSAKTAAIEWLAPFVKERVEAWRAESADRISAQAAYEIARDNFIRLLEEDIRNAAGIVDLAREREYLPARHALNLFIKDAVDASALDLATAPVALRDYLRTDYNARDVTADFSERSRQIIGVGARDVAFTFLVFAAQKEWERTWWPDGPRPVIPLRKSRGELKSFVAMVGAGFELEETQARVIFKNNETLVAMLLEVKARDANISREAMRAEVLARCASDSTITRAITRKPNFIPQFLLEGTVQK